MLLPCSRAMWQLTLPHFGLGLGLGVVDSSLMPLLARLVDDKKGEGEGGKYGVVYAVSQTAVSLAYGLGPLIGGHFAEKLGFPTVMSVTGMVNIAFAPCLWVLRHGKVHFERKSFE